MRAFLVVVAALVASVAHGAQFAVLVCGSKGWWNYRHHADVCHAYHSLRARGVPAENIITMLYDEGVADNPRNPFKGQLFNRPSLANGSAVDLNRGCVKDYTKEDVSPQNFLAVLAGDADAVRASSGSQRVLRSGPDDDVFVNFVDHGAPGMVAMPTGDLYREELLEALLQMRARGAFRRLVFYLEACESGSMFSDLPAPLQGSVWAMTAANAMESSFGTYCPPRGDYVLGKRVGTCLGDEFSVHWLEDTDAELQGAHESLQEQYQRVRDATKHSHVLDFGAIEAMGSTPIDDFLGSAEVRQQLIRGTSDEDALPEGAKDSQVPSRDVKLVSLLHGVARDPTDAALAAELEEELAHRRHMTAVLRRIAQRTLSLEDEDIEAVLQGHGMESPAEQRACHRAANEALKRHCLPKGEWTDFALGLSASLQALCEREPRGGIQGVLGAIEAECASAVAVA